jgi:hypothetical protein
MRETGNFVPGSQIAIQVEFFYGGFINHLAAGIGTVQTK